MAPPTLCLERRARTSARSAERAWPTWLGLGDTCGVRACGAAVFLAPLCSTGPCCSRGPSCARCVSKHYTHTHTRASRTTCAHTSRSRCPEATPQQSSPQPPAGPQTHPSVRSSSMPARLVVADPAASQAPPQAPRRKLAKHSTEQDAGEAEASKRGPPADEPEGQTSPAAGTRHRAASEAPQPGAAAGTRTRTAGTRRRPRGLATSRPVRGC